MLAAAFVGAAGNELVAIYRIRAGRRIGSAALIAEGQHARTDAMTSIAVAIGVIGAWLGAPWIDPLIGLLIAAIIVLVLISSLRTVIRRLMDGIEPEVLERIETVAASVPGVLAVTEVRARWIGHRLDAELVLTVEPHLSLDEGGSLAEGAESELRQALPHLDRALIRVRADAQDRARQQTP